MAWRSAESCSAVFGVSLMVSRDLDVVGLLRGGLGRVRVDLDETHLVLDLQLDLLGEAGVVAEEVADVLLALAQLVAS